MVSVMADELTTEVTAAVTADEPVAARAARAAALIRDRTGTRWVGIYTVTADLVVNEAWSGPAAPAFSRFPVDKGLTALAIASGRPVVSNDVAGDARYLTNQADSGSELIVPVSDGNRVVGTLDVESGVVDAFHEADVERFQRLATLLRALWK